MFGRNKGKGDVPAEPSDDVLPAANETVTPPIDDAATMAHSPIDMPEPIAVHQRDNAPPPVEPVSPLDAVNPQPTAQTDPPIDPALNTELPALNTELPLDPTVSTALPGGTIMEEPERVVALPGDTVMMTDAAQSALPSLTPMPPLAPAPVAEPLGDTLVAAEPLGERPPAFSPGATLVPAAGVSPKKDIFPWIVAGVLSILVGVGVWMYMDNQNKQDADAAYTAGQTAATAAVQARYKAGATGYQTIYNAGVATGKKQGTASGQQAGVQAGRQSVIDEIKLATQSQLDPAQTGSKPTGSAETIRTAGSIALGGYPDWSQTGLYAINLGQGPGLLPFQIIDRIRLEPGVLYSVCAKKENRLCEIPMPVAKGVAGSSEKSLDKQDPVTTTAAPTTTPTTPTTTTPTVKNPAASLPRDPTGK